jgi:multicomponent Na+:H+ antiporter subunit A
MSAFPVALLAPWLHRRAPVASGWILALLPLALTVYFLGWLPTVAEGPTVLRYPWVPGLDIEVSFLVDGLSLLFALLISAIGALILIYSGGYLAGNPALGRLQLLLLLFMGSMIGLVMADNVITLFVFWELTSITSYLLIGFDHEKGESRRAALQSLLLTAGGGLALLTGLLLMGMAGDSYSLSELLDQGDTLRAHPLYLPILLLLLAGAFTKSAQVPFHFWLPNAMAAPTPVSAYLHSATMVKAGVYLLARLSPTMGGTPEWTGLLTFFGGLTALTGALLAIRATDLKRILAYSTVMALGTLVLLIGLGTPTALAAALLFLLAHSLYKGALFLVAGILDHQTGSRDVAALRGLRRTMPLTALFAGLAALSLAGMPPLFGFAAKEMALEAAIGSGLALTLTLGVSATLTVVAAGLVGALPFLGSPRPTPKPAREAPWVMLLGPALLAGGGLAIGLLPVPFIDTLLGAALSALQGAPTELTTGLWHGLSPTLALSAAVLIAGLAGYLHHRRLRELLGPMDRLAPLFPERLYERGMAGLVWLAERQTLFLQNGHLHRYILTTVLTLLALVGYTLVTRHPMVPTLSVDMQFHEAVIGAVILIAAVFAATTRSTLGAVAALGAAGFGIALTYVLFSAPDLGMTQVLVETLTVVLLVLVLYRLPGFSRISSRARLLADAGVSLIAGATITWLLLIAVDVEWSPTISAYFVENSQTLAHGHNIVNVILVDFRALDTLGEITVLALAALGVYAMVRLRGKEG